jgi:hypothetical protein
MPRSCTICAHPERAAIDEALVTGEPMLALVQRYRLAADDVSCHRAAHLPPTPLGDGSSDPADELGSLARELARGYAELVESHQRSWGIGPAEAEDKVREHGEWAVEATRRDPPDQVNWWTLATAMERDPEAARAAWERVKAEARKELHTGHRSAVALEWGGRPWDRARYLAIREAFAADWRPRGGVESALLDLLAQSFSAYLIWTERLSMYHETQCKSEDVKQRQEGYWMPPRLGEARWLDWCAGQAEAAHKRFLATLKALHELRRLPTVFVAGAGQVNVASQQVNVAVAGTRHRRGGEANRPK